MHTLVEIFLSEKKGDKEKVKKKKSKQSPGRKPRKKADVSSLQAFIEQIKRLKELLEAKREYDRIHRQLKQGKHGQSRVIELMREHFANAFKDVGEAYDEALDPVLRLEKLAVRMTSKEMRRADAKRVIEILKEQANPIVAEAIAKAEELADQDPTRIFYEDWELMDIGEAYGYRKDKKILAEGVLEWIKSQGKKLLGKVRSTSSWFKSKGTPELSSIATEIESMNPDPAHSNKHGMYEMTKPIDKFHKKQSWEILHRTTKEDPWEWLTNVRAKNYKEALVAAKNWIDHQSDEISGEIVAAFAGRVQGKKIQL